jgi:hypothetical protein
MKNWGTKRGVLLVGLVGTLLIGALFVLAATDFCYQSNPCTSFFVNVHPWSLVSYIFFTPLVFLLSLLTYRMHDEVFRAWWNFARFMVPIIMLATLLVNMMPSGGGFFNMDGLIYLFVIAPLYAILILVSLWKIFRKYRELKKVSQEREV